MEKNEQTIYRSLNFCECQPQEVEIESSNAGIIPDRAKDDAAKYVNGRKVLQIGIFDDEMPQTIITRVVQYQLDIIQLNGQETATLIRNLRDSLDPDIRPGIQIWKKVSADQCDHYEDVVDAFVMSEADIKEYHGKKPVNLTNQK